MNRALDLVLDRLEGVCRNSDGWSARCPVEGHEHDDRNRSLSVSEGDTHPVLLKCFAGHGFEEIVAALGLSVSDLMTDREGGGVSPPRHARTHAHPPAEPPADGAAKPNDDAHEASEGDAHPRTPGEDAHAQPGVTVAQLAEAKRLPLDFLTSTEVGWRNVSYFDAPAFVMPYLDEHAQEAAIKYRVSLAGPGLRTRWRKGSTARLYGLHRLAEARSAGRVLLLEGESDTVTAWHAGFPALGLPGADGWKESRDAAHLDGIGEVYVAIESRPDGSPDLGGEAVLRWLASSSLDGRARLLNLHPHNDLSELWVANPDRDAFRRDLSVRMMNAPTYASWAAEQSDEQRNAAREQAGELTGCPDVLARFAEDFAAAGVAGLQREAKLLYLAVTSRILERPQGIVVKGVSSAGKSFVIKAVTRFFPASAYHELTASSERALIYGTEPLAHRFLVIAEWAALAGRDFGPYLLRSLISEQKLRYEVTEQDPSSGQWGTRLIERPGPTTVLISTTEVHVEAELETRLLSVTIADTEEQTKAVLAVLADEHTRDVDLLPWHALQEWVARGPTGVTVPYSGALAKLVLPKAVRLRRDFGALLTLVRAHTLLHRATRERDRAGRLVATLEDYAVVRDLIAETIAAAIEASVPKTVRETVQAVRELDRGEGVTRRALAVHLHLDPSSISRRIRRASAYVVNLEEKRGKPARWAAGEALPEDVEVLPTVEQLAERLGGVHACVHSPPPRDPPTHPTLLNDELDEALRRVGKAKP